VSTGADQSAAEIAASVRSGRIGAVAVAEAALARIETHNPQLNAFTDITRERALGEAAAVDRKVAAGDDPGPLAGVPYAVKNLFDIEGLSTRAGSKINREDPPARRDAVLIERLRAAGAVLAGGLNMGEYAYDFTGENAHDGPSRNPHDPAHMSGGSSGGSGTAVAAGMVPLALGSDTNGSIRVPASFCGLIGLKPTYGRLPRTGSFPFVDGLDHLGPFARSVRDLALAYDAMQGPDEGDPSCTAAGIEPVTPALGRGIGDLRLGIAGGYFRRGGEAQAFAAVDRCAEALGVSREVEIPAAAEARAAAYVITNVEGAALHLERLEARADDFDPDVRDRLLAGTMVPAVWYVRAQRLRRWFQDQMRELFAHVDVILAPATPVPAPRIGQKTMTLGGEEMLLRPSIGIYTQPISFVGLPVVAVPLFGLGQLPMGVQVIAAPWREDLALRVAAALEQAGVASAPVAATGG
jgi:aspartyl-tRNA(Asn)/glutamyl-tRNA(Gln) amidotransferase subunit A